MATYEKEGKDIQAEGEQEHKIRITITSKNCSAIERISNELVKAARDKNLKVKVCFIVAFYHMFARKRPQNDFHRDKNFQD